MNAFTRLLLVAAMLLCTGAAAECTIRTVDLAFGEYNPISGEAAYGVGSIHLGCTAATAYSISLSTGQGSYAVRYLQSGNDRMSYNLYTDPAHNLIWGDGTGGSLTVRGMDSEKIHSVYGRIDAGQIAVRPGLYSDLVVVTVEF